MDASLECDTAIKSISGFLEASVLKCWKVFSAYGQPQCRRKLIIAGLLGERGRWSLLLDGAVVPGCGAVETVGPVKSGSQEYSSVVNVMFF